MPFRARNSGLFRAGNGLFTPLSVAAPLFVAMGTLTAGGGTSQTMPLPAFEQGDTGILVAFHGSTGSLNNDPAGWTRQVTLTDSSARPKMRVWTRPLQVGDGNPVVTSTQVQLLAGRTYVFRGLATPVVLEDSGSKSIFDGGNDVVAPTNGCKLPTADPTSSPGMIFCVFCSFESSDGGTTNVPGDGTNFTELHRDEFDGGGWHGRMAAGYYIPPTAGSYAPFNWTVSGSTAAYQRGAYMLCLAPT